MKYIAFTVFLPYLAMVTNTKRTQTNIYINIRHHVTNAFCYEIGNNDTLPQTPDPRQYSFTLTRPGIEVGTSDGDNMNTGVQVIRPRISTPNIDLSRTNNKT